jgi:hypothetical protein
MEMERPEEMNEEEEMQVISREGCSVGEKSLRGYTA